MFACFNKMFAGEEKATPELRVYSCRGLPHDGRTSVTGVHVVVISQWMRPEFMRSADEPFCAPAKVDRSGRAEWCKATEAAGHTLDGLMALTAAKMTPDGKGGYKEWVVKLKVINTEIDGDVDCTLAKGDIDLAEIMSQPSEIELTNNVTLRLQAFIKPATNTTDAYDEDASQPRQ